jgi:hypothetical protein
MFKRAHHWNPVLGWLVQSTFSYNIYLRPITSLSLLKLSHLFRIKIKVKCKNVSVFELNITP